jgi:hypothetical protein
VSSWHLAFWDDAIEANRDDAQSDEGREDKMQNVDSGGEKRSQV